MPGPGPTAVGSRSSVSLSTHGSGPTPGVCPYYHEAIELIGRRWSGAVVQALLAGPMHFSEIAQAIPQMSDRLLSTRLKELEAAGIVSRRVIDGVPVHVEYELTGKGKALEPAVNAIKSWAREWLTLSALESPPAIGR